MSSSKFEVLTQASDISLLTIDELRAAAGVTDDSRDDELLALADQIYEQLAIFCKLRRDGIIPPTFRVETVKDTFRLLRWHENPSPEVLVLSRRPIISITSVVEDDVTLTSVTDFEFNSIAGLLARVNNDYPWRWHYHKVVVTYTAGWETVPAALKMAAQALFKDQLSAGASSSIASASGNLTEIEVPGVLRKRFDTRSSSSSSSSDSGSDSAALASVSAQIRALLGPYINYAAG